MPRARPAYDTDGTWKNRHFDADQWTALQSRLQAKLRDFYPDKRAVEDSTFGHPADQWSNAILIEAENAVSSAREHLLRRTNEELIAESVDLLRILNKAVSRLGTLSPDFDKLLVVTSDVLGTRDKIRELIPRVEDAKVAIASLPKAKKSRDADHFAAVDMAIRVLRLLKEKGVSTAATADKNLGYISDAVKILKVVGDELGLALDETTWKRVIVKAKQTAPDIS